jgi:hypothetical protein
VSYACRLPRKYRLRRGGKLSNRDAAVIAVAIAIAAASAGHKQVAAAVHHAAASAGAVPVTSGSETAFITATLADIGAPATQANITSLADWFPHEFPSWPPAAANNPMATTMPEPGDSIFNYDGVRNYPTASEGAQATAAALEDGYYPGIVAALRSGAGLCGRTDLAGEFLTWSGNGYSGVC